MLKPCGGVACVGGTGAPGLTRRRRRACKRAARSWVKGLRQHLDVRGETKTRVTSSGNRLTVRRGALPGAGSWTHQYANAEQTAVSRDKLVKVPLGLLWFGGPSHEGILPRHGHGPSPQVAGGRLFIEGADMLRAVDVYTGRMIWQRELQGC